MRISRVIPYFDYARLAERYQVFRLRSSKGKFGYADEVFDLLASELTIVSVAFLGGGEAWVMTRRHGDAASTVRRALASRSDMAFYEEKNLERVGERAMLQLCLCAIAGGNMEGASNVCGRLIVVSLGRPNTEYFRGTSEASSIHALGVSVSPRMELELKVRTFTSCKVRRFKRSAPRFELVDGRYLRRSTSFTDANAASLFCQGAKRKGHRHGGFKLMDASSPESFSRSKLGVLRSVLACLDYLFDGAVGIDFEEAEDGLRIERAGTKREKRPAPIAARLGGETIHICDATGELGAEANKVAEIIKKVFELPVEVADDSEGCGAATIRLVQAEKEYAGGEDDPYGTPEGLAAVQHMTPDSGFSKTAIIVAVKELAMKLDIVEGRISLTEWKWGNWDFAVRVEGAEDESFAFLSVGEDGSMRFDGPTSSIGAPEGYADLVDALSLYGDCEFAVRGPDGDVNVVSRTDLFGIPNFEVVWQDLINRREDRKVLKNGKSRKGAIGKGKEDRDLYFADAVDIASCSTKDGGHYYRVGLRGYGMKYSATHKASILREVIAMDGSRALVDDMLPMLDVELVRWGETTVLPFPIKYLREWLAMGDVM